MYILEKPFDYSSAAQSFNVIVTGYYKLEVWGAQGGYGYNNATTYAGGLGGYSIGTVKLNAGDSIVQDRSIA